jgi:predicted 3-demethylubiquinone-9 3-methyltransferase (glyoxalase superfamily)
VSWQIVPTALIELMQAKDATRSARVMKAMLAMTKIDIASLQRAYEGCE